MTYLPSFVQLSSRQVWFQAIGRLLYQTGYGLIQFYIPLIFVKQIGLSATAVGIGIGSGSLAGIVGHFLGGYLADSQYGRKKTLLVSAILSIFAAFVLVLTHNLALLVIANLIMGLSAGCYWTAADAAVIDVTTSEQRHHAFAVLVLADSIGNGLGVFGGGLLLTLFHRIAALFVFSGILFLIFLVLIQLAIVETRHDVHETNTLQGFAIALKDQALRLFVVVNVLFTTYVALVSSTLPLYFTSLLLNTTQNTASSLTSVANLFTWCYVGLGVVLQLPLVQILGSLMKIKVLMISMLLWGMGFFLVWATGIDSSIQFTLMVAAFSVLSIASIIYKPFAPAIVAELAPNSLRGVYLAISYQCWSVGYFIGPIVGGWAMDQPQNIAHHSWLVVSLSTLGGILALYVLAHRKAANESVVVEESITIAQ
ncbi:MFS transporter [Gloeocapsopsis dulcis]|uniref:MFS transporter n=1 Tax=Gloeocapsopsis dulcis AAB1 = 1H9 TaxID=1433147 RepID=A0A6N8FXR8_9CHRO|nr:MFS transporter [Gloeocapsopsis dulcis]MUL37928.1 MFS transporter [Gloeocapsopsis dulcis AAB1 = 1H9]WNN87324.1 MFS transporter [Gloeocapsopsis dulcis]